MWNIIFGSRGDSLSRRWVVPHPLAYEFWRSFSSFSNLATHLPHCMPFNIPSDSQVRCTIVGHLKKVNNFNAFRQVSLEKDIDELLYHDCPWEQWCGLMGPKSATDRVEFCRNRWPGIGCPVQKCVTQKNRLCGHPPPGSPGKSHQTFTMFPWMCQHLTTRTSRDVSTLRCMIIATLISCIREGVQKK